MSFAASSRRLKKRGSGIIVVLARHRLYLAILGFSATFGWGSTGTWFFHDVRLDLQWHVALSRRSAGAPKTRGFFTTFGWSSTGTWFFRDVRLGFQRHVVFSRRSVGVPKARGFFTTFGWGSNGTWFFRDVRLELQWHVEGPNIS